MRKLFPFKPDNIAPAPVEFHTDQVNFIGDSPVFICITLLFDLVQGRLLRFINVHHLEFKDIDSAVYSHRHINTAVTGRIFSSHIQAKRRKIAIKDRRIIPFVFKKLIFTVPVMGDGREQRLKNRVQGIRIIFLESPVNLKLHLFFDHPVMRIPVQDIIR
nr:hypothetical protein [Desulfobacter postgatei]